jgi:hypothetical protein
MLRLQTFIRKVNCVPDLSGIKATFATPNTGYRASARLKAWLSRSQSRVKRYAKRMVWNDRFIRHLPTCEACKAVIAYLRSDSAFAGLVAQAPELKFGCDALFLPTRFVRLLAVRLGTESGTHENRIRAKCDVDNVTGRLPILCVGSTGDRESQRHPSS